MMTRCQTVCQICLSGVAAHCLAAELGRLLGAEVTAPKHVSAVEMDRSCQEELVASPSAPQCLFSDINQFWKPSVREALKTLRSQKMPLNRTTMLPLVTSCTGIQTSGWCQIHQRFCNLKKCRDVFAGFPCVSWSPQGSGHKDLGEDFVAFCSFASVTLVLEDREREGLAWFERLWDQVVGQL